MPNQQAKASTRMMTSNTTTRSTAKLMAAAALALTPVVVHTSVLAQAAGKPQGVSTSAVPAAQPSPAVAEAITTVDTLVKKGKIVQAKSVLDKMMNAPDFDLSSAIDQDAVGLALKSVEKKLRAADPYEVSLQKANLSMQEGNLQLAEQHIKAIVARDSKADSSQKNTAREVLTALQNRRNELLPVARQAIAQATADFEAGRYEAAKSALAGITRTGADLTAEESNRVERYQIRILEVERTNGRPFAAEAANLGVWQPGVVRRDEPGATQPTTPAPTQPTTPPAPAGSDPAAQPTTQPATPLTAPPTTPPTAETPAAQPTTPPAVTPSQPAGPGDDLIRQAMTADGARVIAEGDEKFTEGRYNLALEKYLLAISGYKQYLSAEQLSYAESRAAECRVRMNTGSPAAEVGRSAELSTQRAMLEFDVAMEQADTALKAGDAQQAVSQTAQARLSISKVRQFISEARFAELNAQIDEKNRQIEQKRSEIDAAERDRQAKRQASDATIAQTIRNNEKDRKINENIDRARALQMEQKYEEALQVVDNILFLDPINPSGLLLRDALEGIIIYKRNDAVRRERALRGAYLQLDVAEDMLPPKGMMDYPNEWPKKSFDRG
ncbi:MAG: hypothetical protein IAF94_07185, partial [Pirellulaceae bacterium]|nr:hypothetical protein [Pirellulaceae bacterium]